MLAWTIYLSFAGALACLLTPRANPRATRAVALGTALAGLFCGLAGAIQFKPVNGLEVITRVRWIPALGIDFSLAADGISVTLVLLTGIAALAGVLFSWNVERRTNEFFAFFFALIGGVYGVFLSLDLFLLFVFYEIAIVPKYFLIAIWGSTRRDYAAMKLALYSFIGSGMVLIGMLAAYAVSGLASFDLQALAQHSFAPEFQRWAFPLVFVGFAILAGMWPFHTWAPTGHSAAPTAASMLLAGVVMKLGAYGCIRVGVWLLPEGAMVWSPVFVTLGTIGAVYGGVMAIAQRDFKFVIAHSSVSHMGYVIVGISTMSLVGLNGAVLQMVSHGLMTALFFAMIGAMYDQAHTREVGIFGGLARNMPWYTGFFTIACLASLGLPGLSGFIPELLIFLGAFQTYPIVGILCVATVALAATYMLRLVSRAFFGPLSPRWASLHDLLPNEWFVGAFLVLTLIIVGVYPTPFLDMINASAAPVIERVGGVR